MGAALLTVAQKQQRDVDSKNYLELFRWDRTDFLSRYVTMDETKNHGYTSEFNG